jgi:uncharacterized protein YdcH (DUF465 family)/uncharacterized Zn finger protein (UPF0148 family)
MKLQLLIVAALVACAYAQETHDVDAMVDEHVDRAIKTASDAIATTQKAIGDEKKACDDEIKASQAWMDSIDENKLKAMRARRIRDKKNLLQAVKERITVMSDYLAKLKLARGKLVSVIKHVNHIYGTAYDEAISAQKESAKIMMLLGLSIGHTYNPGSEFSKIKLPREDKEDEGADDAADAAKLDAADKKGNDGKTVCENCDTETTETEPEKEPETTLMEIESSVHASMSRCKGEFCEAAYHYAFDLYKIAHNNAKHDFDDFSADKKIIAFFRTTVSKLIKRKEGRLVNLTKQADELEKSLKEAEGSDKGPLMKIIDMIADHKKRVTDSCAVMKGRSEEMIAELTSLRSCAEGKECGASDPKSQEANSDKSASEAADKLTKEGEDGAKSESATGSATGSASGGASTGASTTVAKTGATGAQNTAEAVFDESAQSK